MPELSHKLQRLSSGGENQLTKGLIYLDSEIVVESYDMRRTDHQTAKRISGYLSLHWSSDNNPNSNTAILRDIVLQLEGNYDSPEPKTRKPDRLYKHF